MFSGQGGESTLIVSKSDMCCMHLHLVVLFSLYEDT